jgi:Lon protease-like protein
VDSQRLPLFALPIVLFPATPLPLHIFEPRYREMLADCMSGDRRFALMHLADGAHESDVGPGSVGCIAEIVRVDQLPDGRSNILVQGTERFAFEHFVPTQKPYYVASVTSYEDVAEYGPELDSLAARLRDVFEVVGRASHTLADNPDPLPELPDEPSLLAFAIAAIIDLDANLRQELLVSRSATDRLRRLEQLLAPAIPGLVTRADVHKRAKSNGKGTHAQP